MSRELKQLIKESKNNFYNVTLKSFLENAPGKFWRYVHPPPASSHENGDSAPNKSHTFNSFFSSVFTRDNGVLPDFTDESVRPPFDDIKIDEQGVFNLLLNINTKKSTGPDGIPNEFLKRYAEWVSKFLTIIFQASINQCSFPRAWKRAKIIPIHKSGSKSEVTNYRPISLISTCSKLLEHIVSKHLLCYLNDYHILNKCQHGFRQGFSTVTQLIETVHDLSYTINSRSQTDIIFLDLAKAFDKVSHPKLLLKINTLFRNPRLSEWFSSYLSHREQFVEYESFQSSFSPVESGVYPREVFWAPCYFCCSLMTCRVTLLFQSDCSQMTAYCTTVLKRLPTRRN